MGKMRRKVIQDEFTRTEDLENIAQGSAKADQGPQTESSVKFYYKSVEVKGSRTERGDYHRLTLT